MKRFILLLMLVGMDLPMRFNGLWIGTGGGGASFVVPVWQFDFTAGVFLRLGT